MVEHAPQNEVIHHMTVYYSTPSGDSKKISSIVFSGGELHVTSEFKTFPENYIQVAARLQSSDAIMELVMATELLRHRADFGTKFQLCIPYLPYARQDRQTDELTTFSLKAFAKIINSLKYDIVTLYDVHSDVSTALIENSWSISQLQIMQSFGGLDAWIKKSQPVIVAPDAGAMKKAWEVAQHYGLPLVIGHKHRDTTTGKISDIGVGAGYEEVLKDRLTLIVDDICDGGGTFVPLAESLRAKGAKSVALYVTHGIFSKGYDVFRPAIGRIYTTDTFLPKVQSLPDQLPVYIGRATPMIMRG